MELIFIIVGLLVIAGIFMLANFIDNKASKWGMRGVLARLLAPIFVPILCVAFIAVIFGILLMSA